MELRFCISAAIEWATLRFIAYTEFDASDAILLVLPPLAALVDNKEAVEQENGEETVVT